MPIALRRAAAEDAAAIGAVVRAGFETYRSFAPAGWQPPAQGPDRSGSRLQAAGAWGVVAVDAGRVVGVGAFDPGREGPIDGRLIPGLAHIWAIFVAESHWGTGAATAILAATVAEIAGRGYAEVRLFTPAGQARARRFYVREGFTETTAPFLVPELGLELVELRRPV